MLTGLGRSPQRRRPSSLITRPTSRTHRGLHNRPPPRPMWRWSSEESANAITPRPMECEFSTWRRRLGSFVPRLDTDEGLVRSFARRSFARSSSIFDRRASIVELRSSSFDRQASIVDRQIATLRHRDLRSAPRIGDRDVAISCDLSSLLSPLSSLLSPDLRDRRSRELSEFTF